jgi:hypothetical protein
MTSKNPDPISDALQEVSPETRFERFGEVKTYRELAMEQCNRLVPVSTLVVLGWRILPSD